MGKANEPQRVLAAGGAGGQAGRAALEGLGIPAAAQLRLLPPEQGLDLRLIQDYQGHKQVQNTVRYTVE